jgi:hypothetical protein
VGQVTAAGAIIGGVSNAIVQRATKDGDIDMGQVLIASGIGAVAGLGGAAAGSHVAKSGIIAGLSETSATELGMLANTAVTSIGALVSGAVLTDIDR